MSAQVKTFCARVRTKSEVIVFVIHADNEDEVHLIVNNSVPDVVSIEAILEMTEGPIYRIASRRLPRKCKPKDGKCKPRK